jgi:hypothetical protein
MIETIWAMTLDGLMILVKIALALTFLSFCVFLVSICILLIVGLVISLRELAISFANGELFTQDNEVAKFLREFDRLSKKLANCLRETFGIKD